jgi:hypothetical protein
VDTHAATEQAAVTSLQGVIYRVLDDDRIGSFRLRCVPVSFGCVELGRQCGVELLGSNQPLQLFTR